MQPLPNAKASSGAGDSRCSATIALLGIIIPPVGVPIILMFDVAYRWDEDFCMLVFRH
jgi:hypothetical protein